MKSSIAFIKSKQSRYVTFCIAGTLLSLMVAVVAGEQVATTPSTEGQKNTVMPSESPQDFRGSTKHSIPLSREDRDLAAQETMASWAAYSFYASVVGILVSVAGLLVIGYSLRLNDDATRAAQKAVEIAENANEIQTRAWLSINCQIKEISHDDGLISDQGTNVIVAVNLKNHGVSPAINVRFHIDSSLTLGKRSPDNDKRLKGITKTIEDETEKAFLAIYPNESIEMTIEMFFSCKDVIEAVETDEYLFPGIIGGATYQTANGSIRRHTLFFYIFESSESAFGKIIFPNESNYLPLDMRLETPPSISLG